MVLLYKRIWSEIHLSKAILDRSSIIEQGLHRYPHKRKKNPGSTVAETEQCMHCSELQERQRHLQMSCLRKICVKPFASNIVLRKSPEKLHAMKVHVPDRKQDSKDQKHKTNTRRTHTIRFFLLPSFFRLLGPWLMIPLLGCTHQGCAEYIQTSTIAVTGNIACGSSETKLEFYPPRGKHVAELLSHNKPTAT